MNAVLLKKERINLSEMDFFEVVIRRVPQPVTNGGYGNKYSLAIAGECCLCVTAVRRAKGITSMKANRKYLFPTLEALVDNFWTGKKRKPPMMP